MEADARICNDATEIKGACMVLHDKCEDGPTKKTEVNRLKTYPNPPPKTHTQTMCKGWEKECVFCNFYCVGNYPPSYFLSKATFAEGNKIPQWYVVQVCEQAVSHENRTPKGSVSLGPEKILKTF